jgi:hypothetical protein
MDSFPPPVCDQIPLPFIALNTSYHLFVPNSVTVPNNSP